MAGRFRLFSRWGFSAAAAALLSGCGWFGGGADTDQGKKIGAEKAAISSDKLVQPVTQQLGTPMAERIATLGFLNKRNGLTRDIQLKPGQSIRIGRAVIRLRACERTAPWELTPEVGAFVQLDVNEGRRQQTEWRRVFSGWLFRESPSLNVIEHPIYDVWVKSCAMSFPGEEAEPTGAIDFTEPRSSASNLANNPSNAANEQAGPVRSDPLPAPSRPAPEPGESDAPATATPAPRALPPEPEPEAEPELEIEDTPEDVIGEVLDANTP